MANKMKRSGNQFGIPTAEHRLVHTAVYTNLVDEGKSKGP